MTRARFLNSIYFCRRNHALLFIFIMIVSIFSSFTPICGCQRETVVFVLLFRKCTVCYLCCWARTPSYFHIFSGWTTLKSKYEKKRDISVEWLKHTFLYNDNIEKYDSRKKALCFSMCLENGVDFHRYTMNAISQFGYSENDNLMFENRRDCIRQLVRNGNKSFHFLLKVLHSAIAIAGNSKLNKQLKSHFIYEFTCIVMVMS